MLPVYGVVLQYILLCVYYTIYYLCFITGETGSVEWKDDDNVISLSRPSAVESEDVISKLIKEQETGKECNIRLTSSSPESTIIIITILTSVQ